MNTRTVYIAVIYMDDDDMEMALFQTEKEAKGWVYDWAKTWFGPLAAQGFPFPSGWDEVIRVYFDNIGKFWGDGEHYQIIPVEIPLD